MEGVTSEKYKFPLFYANLFHKIKYYIQNLRCFITVLLHTHIQALLDFPPKFFFMIDYDRKFYAD